MGFSVMLWGAEKLVPAEYWCPYGTLLSLIVIQIHTCIYAHTSNLIELHNSVISIGLHLFIISVIHYSLNYHRYHVHSIHFTFISFTISREKLYQYHTVWVHKWYVRFACIYRHASFLKKVKLQAYVLGMSYVYIPDIFMTNKEWTK